MRYIKNFENYNPLGKTSGNYLELEAVNDGLWIYLTASGRAELLEEVDDIKNIREDHFEDLFEDIRANSEYIYHPDIGESGFGLTSAPGITDGYYYDDDGEYHDNEDGTGVVYWFPNYMVENFMRTLFSKGKVFFVKAEED